MGRKERRRQQKLVRQGRRARSAGNDRLMAAARAFGMGKLDEARSLCRRVLADEPKNPEALHLMAVLALKTGNPSTALKHLKAAIKVAPDRADLHNNLGNAFTLLKRHDEAAAAFARAAEINPGFAEAHYNRGQALNRLGRHEEAEAAYRRALEITPKDAATLNGLGSVLKALSRLDEAEAAFRAAVESRPTHVGAWLNLANLLVVMERDDDAIAAYEQVLSLEPENPYALAYIYRPLQSACAWDRLAEIDSPLDRATDRAIAAGLASLEEPFLNVSRRADPARNLAVARSWAEAMVRGAGEVLRRKHVGAGDKERLTVGYMSTDFRDHPVAHLIGDLLDLHSRPEFRIFAISAGVNDGSDYRKRIAEGCDRFLDINGVSDADAARLMADQGIDILVDLTGHTRGTRLAVCAWRPAPIQATWLGYPGTTGADFIDYLIADETVLPGAHARFYTEAIIRLRGSYQVNGLQTIADRRPSRNECGLPDDAFVFSSFCQTHKIDRLMFATWTEILSAVPNSVLWLYEGPTSAEGNLRREAKNAGIDPDRIVFAGRLPKEQHLARVSNADLGLDTRIYGGHTTTSDLLLAGVPVISLLGRHFASRVGASVLRATALDELVVGELDEYRDLAIGLSGDPAWLTSLRDRLTKNPSALQLFDRTRFCRNLEAAYKRIWKCHGEGRPPESFTLVADPSDPD